MQNNVVTFSAMKFSSVHFHISAMKHRLKMFDSFLVTATFFYFLAWYFFVPIATAGEIVDRNENIDNKNLLPKAEKEENV